MRKIIFAATVVALFPVFAFAAVDNDEMNQDLYGRRGEENTYLINTFGKNWDVSFQAGAQAFLGDGIRCGNVLKLGDMLCPTFDLSLRKWFSPVFGANLTVNVSGFKGPYAKGVNAYASFQKSTDPLYFTGKYPIYLSKGAYSNIMIEPAVNLTNAIWGYDEERIFQWIAHLGGGVIFPLSKTFCPVMSYTVNAGFDFKFNFSQRWLAGVSVRGAFVGDNFDGILATTTETKTNIPTDAIIGITAGVSYKFGFISRKNPSTNEVQEVEWVSVRDAIDASRVSSELAAAMEDAADAKKKLDAANAEIERLRNQKPEAPVQYVTNVVGDYWAYVNFVIGRHDISKTEKVKILAAAEYIKSTPDIKFVISGYADKATASAEYNAKLSLKRANAVRDMLVNEFGVNPDQLSVESHGGVADLFFDESRTSRSVVIKPQK